MAGQASELATGFRARFPETTSPIHIFRAPGRINLIGDHTDYNGGLVLPMAIERSCWIATATNDTHSLRIHTQDLGESFEQPLASLADATPRGSWSDYVVGVAIELQNAGVALVGQDLLIESTVPIGGGLSSSAAIEVATALALMGDARIEGVALAKLCQRAENNYAGTPCGIMDQFVVVHGHQGGAIRLDCRTLEFEVALLPENVQVVAVNSMVKRELGVSEYGVRRKQCEAASRALGVESLRDVTLPMLESLTGDLLKRARHVITENERVHAFLQAARDNDAMGLGRLLLGSHQSLRDDYEVSCPELDFLVEKAMEIPGVYGARMTGGGFGGCTVNLLNRGNLEVFEKAIRDAYQETYGIDPQIFPCEASAGAERLS